MSEIDVTALERRLSEAVAAEDFELAARLRDELAAAGGPLPPSKLRRQVPGAMGLGTSEQAFRPPPGWVKPKKPDLMTSRVKPRHNGKD